MHMVVLPAYKMDISVSESQNFHYLRKHFLFFVGNIVDFLYVSSYSQDVSFVWERFS